MTVVDVSLHGFLAYDPDEAYIFGPLEEPLLRLNDVDPRGVQWFCDVPEGWDAPAANTPMDRRSWGDGGYAGPTTFEPRPLSFDGTVVAPDQAGARRALRDLLSVASTRQPVLYTMPGLDGPESVWVTASGQPKTKWHDPNAFSFAFVMVAEDPLKFSALEYAAPSVTGLPAPRSGVTFPTHFPTVFPSGSGSDGSVVIVNSGDESAQVIYRLEVPNRADPSDPAPPPVLRPQVVNVTTGLWFTLDRSLTEGDVAEVDTRSATVYLNGVSIFTDLRGSFPLLAPGSNTIRWSGEGTVYSPLPRLTVITASTWK